MKKKIALTCHKCGAKTMTRIEKPYLYEKRVDDAILIFKSMAQCDKCGYVHGVLKDVKCKEQMEEK